ncbi:MAG: RNA pseudouridine synthase [Treponema sp.]|jgi:23S rRNA pseudouridine1911/1915/1917 synthase|nr:RNA pseudouridine synthase [Treponema sp.]
MEKPFVVKEDKHYVVLYKPEKIHSAPLKEGEPGTLLDFCSQLFPDVLQPLGKKKIEGGLIHRLDFETQGLVLFARNQKSLDSFLHQQDEGLFLKQYDAQVSAKNSSMEGFPPLSELKNPPFEIKSAFRFYGPGRQSVRPVSMSYIPAHAHVVWDKDGMYTTNILSWNPGPHSINVRVELFRGFRHQIRAHLAWTGFPIVNDFLYGGLETPDKKLALKAVSLSFRDPETGDPVKVSL